MEVRPLRVWYCRLKFNCFNYIVQLHSQVVGQLAPGIAEPSQQLLVGAG